MFFTFNNTHLDLGVGLKPVQLVQKLQHRPLHLPVPGLLAVKAEARRRPETLVRPLLEQSPPLLSPTRSLTQPMQGREMSHSAWGPQPGTSTEKVSVTVDCSIQRLGRLWGQVWS